MKQVRTAKGRMIDMGALSKANEEVRAVSPGNVIMNARGDRLDAGGNVVQTVQAKSRAVRDTTSAPEKRKLSDAPGAPPKAAAKRPEDRSAKIVRREPKDRDDGTQYMEIEYEDGSIETKELD
jgi:ribosomal protein L27